MNEQYLASLRIVRVDWSQAQSMYERRFSKLGTAEESPSAPTVYTLWRWIVDFLMADFPPRATFLAGFALGLRVG